MSKTIRGHGYKISTGLNIPSHTMDEMFFGYFDRKPEDEPVAPVLADVLDLFDLELSTEPLLPAFDDAWLIEE